MHPRAERFLAHIKGQADTPPVLLLWRGDDYVGIWDRTVEPWVEDAFNPIDGVAFMYKVIRNLIREKRATALLLVTSKDGRTLVTYAEKDGTSESHENGKPVQIPFPNLF